MSAVAKIVLGGVLAFLSLVAYIGWRLEQAIRSVEGIARVVTSADSNRTERDEHANA